MTSDRPFTHRLIGALMLAVAVLGTATLGAPTAGADPGPTRTPPGAGGTIAAQGPPISAIAVLAFGHEVTLSFTTAEPSEVTVTHTPAMGRAAASPLPVAAAPAITPATTPAGTLHVPPGVLSEPTAQHVLRQYTTTHEVKLTGLTSNTAYNVSVVAETQAGQKHTAEVRVLTAKQRVRVTLREIRITDDGDWDPDYVLGDIDNPGEPLWHVALKWTGGAVSACYPLDCFAGQYGAGTIFPRSRSGDSLTWLFAEENFDTMPAKFTLSAGAEEEDLIPLAVIAEVAECIIANSECQFSTDIPTEWQVPEGKESDSTVVRIRADDGGTGFHSELVFTFELFHDQLSYPTPRRNTPSSTWCPGCIPGLAR